MNPSLSRSSLFVLALTWQCSACETSSARPGSPRAASPACTLVRDGFGPPGQTAIRAEVVVAGLEVPWSIGFLSEREMLVTERPGRLRLVRDGTLVPEPVATLAIGDTSEGGLLGLALHPAFAQNQLFYLYFTARAAGGSENKLERWKLAPDHASATREKVLLEGVPGAAYHDGGRIRFGPDGMLYVGTGDARQPDRAQDPNSPSGKILRFTAEGTIPADNPFPGKSAFILGVRNTQGFDWFDPRTLVVTDHGPSGELSRSGHDEVNVAIAGANLGWPTIYSCESQGGMISPSLTWDSAAPPGGAALYRGSKIPEWRESLIIATLGSKHLHRVVFDREKRDKVASHEVYFQNTYGRLREVVMGPDGELYITTSNCDGRGSCPKDKDKVLRVTR